MASNNILHMVTVFIQYEDPKRAQEDGEYTVQLMNFSGTLDLTRAGGTDIDLILEAVGEWTLEREPPKAQFVELTLREFFEPGDPQYIKRYDVVQAIACGGSDGE